MMKKNGKRTRAEAKKLMWEYYRDNKSDLPKWIGEFREEILTELMANSDTKLAFDQAIESVESNTEAKLAA